MIFGRREQQGPARHIYMLIHQIGLQAGGMTLSMMARANLFSRNGWHACLVTTDDRRDYEGVEAEYRRLGALDEDVTIVNIFDFYRDQAGVSGGEHPEYARHVEPDEPGMWRAAPAGTNGGGFRYFETATGRYRLFKQWREDGTLEFVEYFNDAHTKTKRVEYDGRGVARREIAYDPYGSIMIQDRFFAPDGFCFVMRWHGVKNKSVYKVLTFDRAGEVGEYNSSVAWEVEFLNTLAKAGPARPVFIGDGIGAIGKLPQVVANDAQRYMQIHSNHMKSPLLGTPGVREDHERVFLEARKVDGVIVLTDRQRQDVERTYGIGKILHAIPHSFPATPAPSVQREPDMAVSVGRLSEEKYLASAVRAFRLVVDEIPDAVYRIYGTGPERDSLDALIKELGLTKNVFLEGFTDDAATQLARAQVSLTTSVYEGFCMSVAESCLQETPVIAFDVEYGPSDIVPTAAHGSILPTRDEKAMAREIIRYFRDERLRAQVGARARQSVLDRFGEQAVYAKWRTLLR